MPWRPERIISGGQTGADRGGLDAAIELKIPHGGWCPKGRRAEDGLIPSCYELEEHASPDYRERTAYNVADSDATIVFTHTARTAGPGTHLTIRTSMMMKRPGILITLGDTPRAEAIRRIRGWLRTHKPKTLNVAGSRESKCLGLQEAVRDVLMEVLS
jgi:hypothetical protein